MIGLTPLTAWRTPFLFQNLSETCSENGLFFKEKTAKNYDENITFHDVINMRPMARLCPPTRALLTL